ncbi:aminotransferase class V-fold PLP-dependent enzyme [Prosthecomicrobium pneumaticum]|uniref:L-seryl-tRNA(Ser) seleniumtransferase n=1 Tax=Prosthecomicrobium pneumaticum TaxID=81895 RepID=A0A7W9CUM0_9HYPH|nr:PLP-dependent transferase [Prosthecomicrobium pneumaticum]MBB5752210.1 L-seryl-tRNA(Ser) seleniumtransferase [Prosthecomicrobium pneumaticum]
MAAIHDALGLAPVINASGTMTVIGASRVVPEAVAAVASVLPEFVDIADLQRKASAVIAAATGAEAGFVTSSSASAMTLGVAAAMTGADPAAIERLPDTGGLRDEVVVPAGHLVNFGAPVGQMIRLSGAMVVSAGTAFDVQPFHVAAALSERTAAGLFVVSHHVVPTGQPDLPTFVALCRAKGVPVIVDMASEYDLTGAIAAGADLVIWSAHKFLGGPTAGIVAGRKDLVRAAYLQSRGIGRAMKVGKEGIVGAIAALEAWGRRDHAAARARETAIVAAWLAALADAPGLTLRRQPDWTGNPIDRVEIGVGEAAGLFAWELADRLAARTPSIRVRADLVETGIVHLDPCNLDAAEAELVATAIRAEIEAARAQGDGRRLSHAEYRTAGLAAALAWPD